MTHKHPQKTIIGWSEYVELPDWDISGIRAKVDTGARTSALHVESLEVLPNDEVRFEVVLSRRNKKRRVSVVAASLKKARVRSSTGVYRKRCFVMTRIRIGPVEKEIELSLVSREKMIFRMLLGRKALEHDFLVDVSHRTLLGTPPSRGERRRKKRA